MNIFIPNNTDRAAKKQLARELSANPKAPLSQRLILCFADPREGWHKFTAAMQRHFPNLPQSRWVEAACAAWGVPQDAPIWAHEKEAALRAAAPKTPYDHRAYAESVRGW